MGKLWVTVEALEERENIKKERHAIGSSKPRPLCRIISGSKNSLTALSLSLPVLPAVAYVAINLFIPEEMPALNVG